MIAIDSNILLRFVVRDDDNQYRKAAAFLTGRTGESSVFVSAVVLMETVWVLRRHYRYSKAQVESLVSELLQAVELSFEQEEYLSILLSTGSGLKGDIADYLVALSADRAGCAKTVTFDRRAAKAVPGMELLA